MASLTLLLPRDSGLSGGCSSAVPRMQGMASRKLSPAWQRNVHSASIAPISYSGSASTGQRGASRDRPPPGMRRRHFRRREELPSAAPRGGQKGDGGSRRQHGSEDGQERRIARASALEGVAEAVGHAAETVWHSAEGIADSLLQALPKNQHPAVLKIPPGFLPAAVLLICAIAVSRAMPPLWRLLFGTSVGNYSSGTRLAGPQMLAAAMILTGATAAAVLFGRAAHRALASASPSASLVLSARERMLLALLLGMAAGVAYVIRFPGATWRVLNSLGFSWDNRYGGGQGGERRVRDRSLAGREVVVSQNKTQSRSQGLWPVGRKSSTTTSPLDPVGPEQLSEESSQEKGHANARARRQPRKWAKDQALAVESPDWWKPEQRDTSTVNSGVRDAAQLLISGMMSKRLRGQDFDPDDILQLYSLWRQGCGPLVVQTVNSRDELFRAAVGLGITTCAEGLARVQLEPQTVPHFLACLAPALGIPSGRALTMVLAALAARMRSTLQQAWALFKQGRDREARAELRKLSNILHVLPLPQQAAEMEMLASGMEVRIPREDREDIRDDYHLQVDKSTSNIVSAALGLS